MGLDVILHRLVGDARLDDDVAVIRRKFQNPVHALEGGHHTLFQGHGSASGAGAATARRQRDGHFVAKAHQFQRLFVTGREHHGIWQNLALAVVVAVNPAVGRVGQEAVGREELAQSRQKGMRQ